MLFFKIETKCLILMLFRLYFYSIRFIIYTEYVRMREHLYVYIYIKTYART